jgi:hypothetical protein
MTTVNSSEIGVPWNEVRQQLISSPSKALAYLDVTQEEDPEMVPQALANVLEACPHVAGVAIPLYVHLLKASDLERLSARFPEAAQYIKQYGDVLTLLLSA